MVAVDGTAEAVPLPRLFSKRVSNTLMLLLVTDTSGKDGFVGLVHTDENKSVSLIEEVPLAGGTFSAQLVPQISGLLNKHGFSKTEIDAFVVVSGPGSFTGLRVGLAAIKALAEILEKPIVPVSLLEVVATATGRDGRVLAALDAGRGEVYIGEYSVAGETAEILVEQIVPRDRLLEMAERGVAVTPDRSLVESAPVESASVRVIERPRSAKIAAVGVRRLKSGQTVSPEQLEANYIRRSDAEIFAKPASSS